MLPTPKDLPSIVENICTIHRELATLRGQELDAEMTGYLSCDESSQEAKKRSARYSAAVFTKEVWAAEAELQSLIEQKFYLLRLESQRHAD
jgi:hypothetical protein